MVVWSNCLDIVQYCAIVMLHTELHTLIRTGMCSYAPGSDSLLQNGIFKLIGLGVSQHEVLKKVIRTCVVAYKTSIILKTSIIQS